MLNNIKSVNLLFGFAKFNEVKGKISVYSNGGRDEIVKCVFFTTPKQKYLLLKLYVVMPIALGVTEK